MDATTGTTPLARIGLWLLPLYAALLAVGTVTAEPDRADFDAYARYVTTGPFLASHLAASILGAAFGAVGAVAVLAYLHRGDAGRLAAWGAALMIAGNVVTAAVFGAAAFAQPAIGRAHLRGLPGLSDINADVYGAPLVGTAIAGLLMLVAGGICLGLAVRRGGDGLRGAGAAFATLLAVFAVGGFVVPLIRPVAAAGLTVAAVLIALRLPRVAAPGPEVAGPVSRPAP